MGVGNSTKGVPVYLRFLALIPPISWYNATHWRRKSDMSHTIPWVSPDPRDEIADTVVDTPRVEPGVPIAGADSGLAS